MPASTTELSTLRIEYLVSRMTPLGPIVDAVADLLERPRIDYPAIGSTVARCPVMTLQLLAQANGPEWDTKTARPAVAAERLGADRLAAFVTYAQSSRPEVPEADPISMRLLGLANRQARTAHFLAALRLAPGEAEEAQVAALLAGVGLFVMKEAGGLGGRPADPDAALEWEADRFGMSHPELVEWVARRSLLPAELARAIGEAGGADTPASGLSRAVWLALRLVSGRADAAQAAIACGFSEREASLLVVEQAIGIDGTPVFSGLRAPCPLSAKQLEYMRYLVAGHSSGEIALMVGRTRKTIDNTVSACLRKLNVGSRTHAVLLCTRQGWV